MSTPEGRVKDKLKRRLTDTFGNQCWRFMPVQTGYGAPALDFILCFRGWFVTIETKTPKGEFSPTQKNTRRETLEAGGFVFCAYDDETIDYCINYLKELEFIHGRYFDGEAIPFHSQDAGERKEYLRQQQQDEAPPKAARRDHGAPRKQPKRQPVKGAGGDDPAGVTATVTDEYTLCGCGLETKERCIQIGCPQIGC